MSQTLAFALVLSAATIGIVAGLRLPVRSAVGERISLLRVVGFSLIPAVGAVLFGKSVIDSSQSGTAVLSYRLGLAYDLAASPVGFYLVALLKLFFVMVFAMTPLFVIRVYRSQT